ncbi:MAG TPA: DUF4124 domain-containing protein [Ochrobactrum intermedium]|uniref:DUF4124 domain-containing protein n=1 Tax=Brucella intermedia TaxID=94625 RepID=A0A7V6PDL1_9HYPH|nr:hypothetical protein [Brucella intermedia]HHV68920.1 DUF4124 domain-containing protein [Brucella intermedia]
MKYTPLFVIVMLYSASACAAYKCVSPEGKTSYQERPCESGKETKVLREAVSSTPKFQPSIDKATAPQRTQDELQAAVRASLKDPDSANFNDLQHVGDGRALCGQVNAKNSYGGYTGFKRFVADFEGVYWAGDGSAQVDIGRPEARRTYVPKANFWGCP